MKTALFLCSLGFAEADLRLGSWPRDGFKARQYNNGNGRNEQFVDETTVLAKYAGNSISKNRPDGRSGTFVTSSDTARRRRLGGNNKGAIGVVPYMEPSAFSYQGLQNQRQNNYDNFLRSNIDNEQDNRDFNNEAGKDHQPFRSYEGQSILEYPHGSTNNPGTSSDIKALQAVANNNLDTYDVTTTIQAGSQQMLRIRWNNPHAAELEVNLWLMHTDPPYVVPVKRPVCSGEGNQDNVINFKIPADFNSVDFSNMNGMAKQLGCGADATAPCAGKAPTKKLCEVSGDCVLQFTAHSVEPRQYAFAFPVIITDEPCKTDATLGGCQPIPDEITLSTATNAASKLGANPSNAPAVANDIIEANPANYKWPTTMNLQNYLQGKPAAEVGVASTDADLADVKICASRIRNGPANELNPVDTATEVVLTDTAQTVNTNGNGFIYLCGNSASKVDTAVFTVTGAGAGAKTENQAPFEYNPVTTSGTSEVSVVLTGYGAQKPTATITGKVTWNVVGGRRRHLEEARRRLTTTPKAQRLANTPNPKHTDPGLELSLLAREICLSTQDAAANYLHTSVQEAKLCSDVNNHAYQNSNYSPYCGQQQGEISRNLQAALVVHMTASNFGELGKAAIQNSIVKAAKQLKNQVNNAYQNYEKAANQVIDRLTNLQDQQQRQTAGVTTQANKQLDGNQGRNTGVLRAYSALGGTPTGVQPLARSFRASEKGATSEKRQKTTTYVPSFKIAPQQVQGVQAQLAAYEGGKYTDLVTQNANGDHYVQIYQATFNKLLPAFQAAADLGISYMPVVEKPANGPMDGGSSATMQDPQDFKKRDANGKKDGGKYAGTLAFYARNERLYGCDKKCTPTTELNDPGCTGANKKPSVAKLTKATCVGTLADGTVCTPCYGLFNMLYAPAKEGTATIALPSVGGMWGSGGKEKEVGGIDSGIPSYPGVVLPRNAWGQRVEQDSSAECWTDSYVCNKGAIDNPPECNGLPIPEGETFLEVPSTEIEDMCKDKEGDKGFLIEEGEGPAASGVGQIGGTVLAVAVLLLAL